MKKSNVTDTRAIKARAANGRGGFNSAVRLGPKRVGWLIYCPNTDDFLHSYKAGVGHSSFFYTKEPALAYCFISEQSAFRYSMFIEKSIEIVPLFDFGDSLAVGFK